MKTLRLAFVVVAVALACTACANPSARKLSYAEVQAVNPGVSVDWILAEYPEGRVTRGPDGKVTQIRYSVADPQGSAQTLVLHFDANGVLRQKRYSGPVLRPGGAQGGPKTR